MDARNPWAVENIEAFSFYCCPECDFKSKDGDHFERHALESHNRAKSFFIALSDKKSGNNTTNRSETRLKEDSLSESEGGEFVRLSEHKEKSHINSQDYITHDPFQKFADNETADNFEFKLNTFDDPKLEELEIFDDENYENVTDAETSDDDTFDIINKELETFDDHDVEKTKSFNGEMFDNVTEIEISDKDNEAKETMNFNENITEEKKDNDDVSEDAYIEDNFEYINESKQDIDSKFKTYVVNTPKCPICEKKNHREELERANEASHEEYS